MCYAFGMNIGNTVKRGLGTAAVVCALAVVVGAMVAPLFEGWIERVLYREYALDSNCEKKVAVTMVFVSIGLWLIAIAAWAFVIWCNANY